ncbi:amino acid ABC transporter substrate-binding protein [Asticcacaulis machinosus]|uniref:Amino acid ABC transporter substrate-binding protein n=1 Tax=Asticcacaulis machinosus TaxID=2984211 RepID=A0ABT5HF12_9CAUL|nr:amino acid ABC transporter substrate-binding protein [Asticcacaulis machinosus]MDC7674839.1 amino acid ABC transporter substrate-binding protein [Asticcacaulis machinosus]
MISIIPSLAQGVSMPLRHVLDNGSRYLLTAMMAVVTISACSPRTSGDDAPSAELKANVNEGKANTIRNNYGATLKSVQERGHLNCGVHPGLVGFSYRDNRGEWKGFDVDFCRAMAAAIFDDPAKVNFIPLETDNRFGALRRGQIDVLWRNSSWTMSRDTTEGLNFGGTNYYDGQGFLVRRSLRLNSATELNGARICVQSGSTTELNLADYFRIKAIKYTPIVVATEDEARAKYANESCDAFSSDISALAAARTTLNDPQNHVILPDVISKEPLGPVLREGDAQWDNIVRWTLNALILAEEYGVTSKNIDDSMKSSPNSEVRRLLGADSNLGKDMGLNAKWAYNAIKRVGNYGEIFDRNVGSQSPLNLDRGLNAQWNSPRPGLIYAPPAR